MAVPGWFNRKRAAQLGGVKAQREALEERVLLAVNDRTADDDESLVALLLLIIAGIDTTDDPTRGVVFAPPLRALDKARRDAQRAVDASYRRLAIQLAGGRDLVNDWSPGKYARGVAAVAPFVTLAGQDFQELESEDPDDTREVEEPDEGDLDRIGRAAGIGWFSNIIGNLLQFHRQANEAARNILRPGTPVALAMGWARNLRPNQNHFRLSAGAHARQAYVETTVAWAEANGYTLYRLDVPRGTDLSPGGLVARHAGRILTLAAWLELSRRVNENRVGAATVLDLGFTHGDPSFLTPVREEWLD